jgi:hypothetical protein
MYRFAILLLNGIKTMYIQTEALQSNAYNNSYLLPPTSYLKRGESC